MYLIDMKSVLNMDILEQEERLRVQLCRERFDGLNKIFLCSLFRELE